MTQKIEKPAIPLYFQLLSIGESKDLMTQGKSFYAVWDQFQNKWLTNEMKVIKLVDDELWKYANKLKKEGRTVTVLTMKDDESGVWKKYTNFIKYMPNNYHPLDSKILFANDVITRESYASRFVPYVLEKGSIDAYDELMNVLYNPEERDKLEWAIGSILTGDSKHLQKIYCIIWREREWKIDVLKYSPKVSRRLLYYVQCKVFSTRRRFICYRNV